MKVLPTVLLTGVLLCVVTPMQAQSATRDVSRPAAGAGKLSAAEIAGGFLGLASNFGRRADADGDLIIVADDLTAGIMSISNGAFEIADLLALSSVTNITRVLDVAIEGDRALVFVQRSNGAERSMLLGFRRVVVLGSPSWLVAGVADPAADLGFGAAIGGLGYVELRDGIAVLALTVEAGGFSNAVVLIYAQSTSALTFRASEPSSFGTVLDLAVGASFDFIGTPDEISIVVGIDSNIAGSNLAFTYAATEINQAIILADILDDELATGTDYASSVAIQANSVAVGEPGADVGGIDTGRVVLYSPGHSPPTGVLTSPTPTDGDRFGRDLAMSDDDLLLAISEHHSDAIPGGIDSGYVRLAESLGFGNWALTHDTLGFGATVSGPDENLGADLSFGANNLLIAGAPGTSTLDGFITWFFLPSSPWVEVNQSPALAGTGGEFPELLLEGGVFADGPIVVGVRNAAPSSTTFAIIGLSTIFAPAKGGIVYPSLDILKAFPTNAAGEFIVPTTWTQDFAALGPLNMHFQFWTVDAGGVSGFSATEGGVLNQF